MTRVLNISPKLMPSSGRSAATANLRLKRICQIFLLVLIAGFSHACTKTPFADSNGLGFQGIKSLAINEDGQFEASWSAASQTTLKGKGFAIYLQTMSELPEAYRSSFEKPKSLGPLSYALDEWNVEDSPRIKGVQVGEVIGSSKFALQNVIDPSLYYVFEVAQSSAGDDGQGISRVIIARATLKTVENITVTSKGDTVTASWNAVAEANGYDIFADEQRIRLLGSSTEPNFTFDLSSAPASSILWIASKRGAFLSSALTPGSPAEYQAQIQKIYPVRNYARIGLVVPFQMEFSRIVKVEGPALLTIDETGRMAQYRSGSGTNRLLFEYLVTAGDSSFSLKFGNISGASLKDEAGRILLPTLPSHITPSEILIDSLTPNPPLSVGFSGSVASSLPLRMSWAASTDPHFNIYVAKMCRSQDCATDCLSVNRVKENWALMTGEEGESYYGCVQAVDQAETESVFASSTSPVLIAASAPQLAKLTINGGAAVTNSLLTSLTMSAVGASEMSIGNSPSCADSNWIPFASSMPWTLGQSNAVATVYARFRNVLGRETECKSATILHDASVTGQPRVVIDSAAPSTASESVTLTLTSLSSAPESMYITNSSGCSSGGSWEPYRLNRNWILGQTEGIASVYVKYRNAASEVSACVSDTIIHSTTALPSAPSVSINAGAATSLSLNNTLTLSVGNATEMYITNSESCSSGGIWEPFVSSKAWTLALGSSGTSPKVYVKYRNAGILESPCVSDTIFLSGINPNGGFETGDTSSYSMSNIGSWSVQGSERKSGSYAAQSALITDSQTTCILQSVDLTAATGASIIEFAWKVSSESNYDKGIFYINSVSKSNISGITSWSTLSFPLPMGATYELKWCYSKDSSDRAGLDALWVDDITVSRVFLRPPTTFSAARSNEALTLTVSGGSSLATGHLLVRSSGNIAFAPVNGVVYSPGPVAADTLLRVGAFTSFVDSGLTNGRLYNYALWSYDSSHNYSLSKTVQAAPSGSNTPTNFVAIAGVGQISLSWTSGGGIANNYLLVENDFTGIPFTPTAGTEYPIGPVNGGKVIQSGTASSFIHSGLNNLSSHMYTVWSYDSTFLYSPASASIRGSLGNLTNPSFETGDLSAWTSSGVGSWTVQTSTKQSGSYAAKPPLIADSQSSCIEQSFDFSNLTVDALVSFYWRASSEPNYDLGQFYLDGVAKANISGNTGWQLKSVRLPSGMNHVLKWCYVKDNTDSENSDTFYLDNISLSFIPTANYPITSLLATAGDSQVSLNWDSEGGNGVDYLVVGRINGEIGFSPVNGTSYSVGAVTGAIILYKGKNTSFLHTGLSNGIPVYYKVYSVDDLNSYHEIFASAKAVPQP